MCKIVKKKFKIYHKVNKKIFQRNRLPIANNNINLNRNKLLFKTYKKLNKRLSTHSKILNFKDKNT